MHVSIMQVVKHDLRLNERYSLLALAYSYTHIYTNVILLSAAYD
jgi:hypothetical protein